MLERKKVEAQVKRFLEDPPPETTGLDYKLEFHKNKAKLIHHILCLANARYDGTRFLIFGVEDKTFDVVGIEQDLISNNIHNLISSIVWNHKPAVLVGNVTFSEKTIGYFAIEDQPLKPFYLRQHYKDGEEIVQAGTIYTRHGDTNTPYKAPNSPYSVEDGELVHMFRERFGLDKTPLDRATMLLRDYKNWRLSPKIENGPNVSYYHKQFPEYQVILRDYEEIGGSYDEVWIDNLEPRNAMEFYKKPRTPYFDVIEVKYLQTILTAQQRVFFDGGHRRCLSPSDKSLNGYLVFYFLKDSIEDALQDWLVARELVTHKAGYNASKDSPTSVTPFPSVDKDELDGFLETQPRPSPGPSNQDRSDCCRLMYENQRLLTNYLEAKRNK